MIRRRDEEEQDKQEGASWIMGAFSYLCKGNETRKKRMRLDLVQKNIEKVCLDRVACSYRYTCTHLTGFTV